MKKKLFAIILALAMVVGLLSGCGSSDSASEASSNTESTEAAESAEDIEEEASAESTEEVIEEKEEPEEQEEEPEEELIEESMPEPEEEPVEEEPANTISYPVGDGSVTFTTWVSEDPEFLTLFDEWETACITLENAEEATGVNLSVTTVSILSANDQYNLMFASGEWPDYVSAGFYTGGIEQAYDDDVIIELTEDMLDTFMPDYQSYKNSMNQETIESITNNGMNLAIYALTDHIYQDRGIVIRDDWLNELGLDVPTTLDELTEMMYAFHNTYGSDHTYDVNGGGVLKYMDDAFDTYVMDASGSDPSIFVRDGKVCTPLTDDNYRAYVEWFSQLYEDGVVNRDFVTDGNTGTVDRYGLIADGRCAIYESRAEIIEDVNNYMDTPITPIPMGNITDDGVDNWEDPEVYTENDFGSISITSTCKDPELLMEFLNYFFTDEGAILANYGVEGVTYTMGANGEYEFTELLTDSELVFSSALTTYCVSKAVPYFSYQDRKWMYSSDAVVNAINTWTAVESNSDRVYPEGASLTAEETSSVTVLTTDIMTYADGELMKFLTAAEPLTDDAWNAYLAELDAMGLQDVLDVYQNAYDEYLAGER